MENRNITGFRSGYEMLSQFESRGHHPVFLTISRDHSVSYTYSAKTGDDQEENRFYLKKIALTLIWLVGGTSLYIKGKESIVLDFINYSKEDRELQISFSEMEKIYQKRFRIERTDTDIQDKEEPLFIQGDIQGERIGLDLGGSDRKVSAVRDGKVVFSEETLWSPKTQSDISYHYQGILESLNKAKSHLSHIDHIGISTAGIVKDSQMLQASLFRSVKDENHSVRNFFPEFMKKEFPGIPYRILNDGDVSALSGSIRFQQGNLLGIAMGTSLGGGYVRQRNTLNGWIVELGKIPIDYSKEALVHYAMSIQGAGSEYLSQKGIIRILKERGITYEGELPKQLMKIQEEAEKGNPEVIDAYKTFGILLGETVLLYHHFFPFDHVLLLGRVMSRKGGDILLEEARQHLKKHHIQIALDTADETFRRLGQSYIASML